MVSACEAQSPLLLCLSTFLNQQAKKKDREKKGKEKEKRDTKTVDRTMAWQLAPVAGDQGIFLPVFFAPRAPWSSPQQVFQRAGLKASPGEARHGPPEVPPNIGGCLDPSCWVSGVLEEFPFNFSLSTRLKWLNLRVSNLAPDSIPWYWKRNW